MSDKPDEPTDQPSDEPAREPVEDSVNEQQKTEKATPAEPVVESAPAAAAVPAPRKPAKQVKVWVAAAIGGGVLVAGGLGGFFIGFASGDDDYRDRRYAPAVGKMDPRYGPGYRDRGYGDRDYWPRRGPYQDRRSPHDEQQPPTSATPTPSPTPSPTPG
ncbi:hypothetical protein EV193_102342 [Herbihabitans rhizosphaerae]|uniref:Uncharacterized protein n=1 Tax=Herbihabitans rhizosphaerae TaxID=1872711 RepID=A0A4V2EU52_9PSEU|nr:hypothetical protein [Herbihabitans rhizosphaerae]RZS43363.1 hypothetical protein EV193_102342 [Herbihabitans rhizosphaerae]